MCDRCLELEEQIIQLKEAFAPRVQSPLEWKLTETEERLLEVLLARIIATEDMIMTWLYSGGEYPEHKIIDVFICKMRKKLKRHGIEIETVWGRGYRLTAGMKDKVRGAINAAA